MRFDSGLLIHSGDISAYPNVEEWLELPPLLESCGYTGVWCAEHHFFWDGWITPTPTNPLLFAAYVSRHTTKLRIGSCGVGLPDWHPIRAAEDAAMVDHMTQGRLEFGFMRGLNNVIAGNFHPLADRRDQKTNNELMWEAFEVVRKAWSGKPFRHDGKYFTFPYPWRNEVKNPEELDPNFYTEDGDLIALEVLPTPFQKPMPPCWLMADSTSSTALAARAGVGAVNWGQSFESTRETWAAYREAARDAADSLPPGANPRVAMMRPVFVAEDAAVAEAVMRPAINGLLSKLYGLTPSWNGRKAFLASYEEESEDDGNTDWYDFLKEHNWCLVGTPEEVTEVLKRFESELGMEHLILYWAMPGVTFEQMTASVKLFADKVMPNFNDAPPTDVVTPPLVDAAV